MQRLAVVIGRDPLAEFVYPPNRLMSQDHRRRNWQVAVLQVDVGAADAPHVHPGHDRPRPRLEDTGASSIVSGSLNVRRNSSTGHCWQCFRPFFVKLPIQSRTPPGTT